MQVRWRQHEIIFVTAIVSFYLINWLVQGLSGTIPQIKFLEEYFLEQGLIFDYTRNYLVPRLIPALLLYIVFLFINLYLIPYWIEKKRSRIITLLYLFIAWCVLVICFAYSYRLETISIPDYTSKQLLQKSFRYGFYISSFILIPYILYLWLRTATSSVISRPGIQQSFRIVLSNRITTTVFSYMGGFFFLMLFGVLKTDTMAIFYVFFLVPLIATCLINIYGLFPYQYRKKIPIRNFFWKLLIAPLILSIISLAIFIAGGGRASLVLPASIMLFQLLIGTPLSWLLFTQERDKLESLHQLQSDLGKTSADLQFLRSQINPHFLFNALNTIYGTALQENAERTADGVQRLGDMMRFMLHENLQEKIPVSREIEYLQNYIQIQELRTSQSPDIVINTTLPATWCPHKIAPMLLIPFVENAFKHGISLNKKSWINIHLSCSETSVRFEVHNSIHINRQDDPEKNHTGIGLENVRQRLQLLYPSTHELKIHQSEREYFVHLNITLI